MTRPPGMYRTDPPHLRVETLVVVGSRPACEQARFRSGHPPADTIVVSDRGDLWRLRGLDPRRVRLQVLDGAERLADWHLIYVEVTYLQRAIERLREPRPRRERLAWKDR